MCRLPLDKFDAGINTVPRELAGKVSQSVRQLRVVFFGAGENDALSFGEQRHGGTDRTSRLRGFQQIITVLRRGPDNCRDGISTGLPQLSSSLSSKLDGSPFGPVGRPIAIRS